MKSIAAFCIMSILAVSLVLCDALEAGSREHGILGIEIKTEGGWLTVVGTVENTPASRGGLLAGDRIVSIDGKSTENKALSDCLRELAGAVGEDVTLTVVREPGAKRLELTLTRASMISNRQSTVKANSLPPDSEPVRWKGNKIISRVLPYSDFDSLFIRLPIAHAAATGKGVSVGVIQIAEDKDVSSMIQRVAPQAEVKTWVWGASEKEAGRLVGMVGESACRVALICDVQLRPGERVVDLAKRLIAKNIVVVIPSDLSEDEAKIETINTLHGIGALTVGRVDRQSRVVEDTSDGVKAFNSRIRSIQTDVFSTVGLVPYDLPMNPVATVGGIAALVLEKWPDLTVEEVRERIISGSRKVWQATSIETGKWQNVFSVDPVTSEYKPRNEEAIFRFRAADAAGALGVDTEIPWFLNMLNCHKAWEITRGRGILAVVTDQGFHTKHPELKDRIKATKHFGRLTFDSPNQNFHGTDMSRIFLSIAPEAEIIPVLCSADSMRDSEDIGNNIARSFRYAAEQKADVITSSWAIWFNENEELLSAVRHAVDSGVVVSWFHYPKAYPGLLRSKFTYSWWERESSIGFADRFLTDPPGLRPVEIGAGLSETAPQAAGVAALVKSANPALTPKQIEELIFENSTPIGNAILVPDAYKAVLAARQLKGSATAERPGREDNATVRRTEAGKTADGAAVHEYTLTNGNGLEAKVLTYGATLTTVKVPDKNGKFESVTLYLDSFDDYLKGHPLFGSVVGRFANRIAGAQFEIDGVTYKVTPNAGANHIHGGREGFHKLLWQAESFQKENAVGVILRHTSPDGDEGYPGKLDVTVTYTLTNDNELVIDYAATTDKPTVVNLTNHAYWNLAGAGSGDVLGHILTLDAESYLPSDKAKIPTGETKPVKGTVMDFTTPQSIGSRIKQAEGENYDHCYVIKENKSGRPELCARVVEPKSGRVMEVFTTQPGVQLYTAKGLSSNLKTSRFAYGPYHGLCLETQHYPDAPNKPNFPSTVLRPGETFRQTTIYKFSVQK